MDRAVFLTEDKDIQLLRSLDWGQLALFDPFSDDSHLGKSLGAQRTRI